MAEEMPPPIAPADSICIIMKPGEHQRHAGQRVGAETRDEPGLDQPGRGLRQHHQDIRPREAQQCRHDRPVQQRLGARIVHACGAAPPRRWRRSWVRLM